MVGGGGGVMNWEIGIDMYTLMCIKWMTNKNLLCKKKNSKIKKKKKDMALALDPGHPSAEIISGEMTV